MPLKTRIKFLIVVLVAAAAAAVAYAGGTGFPARVLKLERAFPANKTVELEVLKARDRARHARILQGFAGGIVDFNVIGTSDPYYGGSHYNLDLQSIAVNRQLLPIDPAVFATSDNQGTIVDSGTTLTYLVAEAFDPFVDAITASVSQSVTPVLSKGTQCYLVMSSISEIFPTVSLNFAGDVSMVLKPENYLVHGDPVDGGTPWCIGFQKVQNNGISILGDLVLKDKIFVYDLSKKRIGWTDYDCSADVNVSITSSKDEFISSGELSESSSSSLEALIFHTLALCLGSSLW